MTSEHVFSSAVDVIDIAASQSACDRAWAEYCAAMSMHGRDSAEVLAAYHEWMQLKQLHEFHLEMVALRRT